VYESEAPSLQKVTDEVGRRLSRACFINIKVRVRCFQRLAAGYSNQNEPWRAVMPEAFLALFTQQRMGDVLIYLRAVREIVIEPFRDT